MRTLHYLCKFSIYLKIFQKWSPLKFTYRYVFSIFLFSCSISLDHVSLVTISFWGITFIQWTINILKIQISNLKNIYTRNCNHTDVSCALIQSITSIMPHEVITILTSITIAVCRFWASYKWNYTVCSCLCPGVYLHKISMCTGEECVFCC